jgi:predicted transcriptional regulator
LTVLARKFVHGMMVSYQFIPTPMDDTMPKTAKVTISLPEELLAKADAASRREHRTRSELMREALRHYLHLTSLAVEEPTAEERAAIAAGRAEHARGDTLTHDELFRDLEAHL